MWAERCPRAQRPALLGDLQSREPPFLHLRSGGESRDLRGWAGWRLKWATHSCSGWRQEPGGRSALSKCCSFSLISASVWALSLHQKCCVIRLYGDMVAHTQGPTAPETETKGKTRGQWQRVRGDQRVQPRRLQASSCSGSSYWRREQTSGPGWHLSAMAGLMHFFPSSLNL